MCGVCTTVKKEVAFGSLMLIGVTKQHKEALHLWYEQLETNTSKFDNALTIF
tara:strand:- start:91 stop:246 length:156 start_codon:yes stop_codon:yes gene_type:complete